MYRCEISGKVSKPGEKAFRIITKTRKRDYYENRTDDKGFEKTLHVGTGWEIVEEKVVCEEIYNNFNGKKY